MSFALKRKSNSHNTNSGSKHRNSLSLNFKTKQNKKLFRNLDVNEVRSPKD